MWCAYAALVGYLGGIAFEHEPIKGLLLGFGLAATVTATVELIRHLRRRHGVPVTVARSHGAPASGHLA